MKLQYDHKSLWIWVGPWLGRLQWDRNSYGFAYYDNQGPVIRRIRRWWTGWHRWEDQ